MRYTYGNYRVEREMPRPGTFNAFHSTSHIPHGTFHSAGSAEEGKLSAMSEEGTQKKRDNLENYLKKFLSSRCSGIEHFPHEKV